LSTIALVLSAPRRRAARMCGLMAALVVCAAMSTVHAQPVFDAAGVKPGMTEVEAIAAIQAHRSGGRVQKRTMTYSYSDGVQQLNTPAFLYEIVVMYDGKEAENFRLYFAPAPSESRVVGFTRSVVVASPPTQAQLSSQLGQKYGTPVATGKNYADLNMVWGEPGKPMCWRTTPKTTSIGQGEASDIVGLLKRQQAKGNAPADLSQCGVAASATLVGEPVRSLTVRITDYGAWASTQAKAQQWVEGMREAAVKSRLGKGAGPKL
jgi:hypothetical protein